MSIYGWLLVIAGFFFGLLDAVKIVQSLRNKRVEAHCAELQDEVQTIEKQVLTQGRTAMFYEGRVAAYEYRTGQPLTVQAIRTHAQGEAESYAHDFPCAESGYDAVLVDAWIDGFSEVYTTMQQERQQDVLRTTAQRFTEAHTRMMPNRENTPRRTDALDEPTQHTRSLHRIPREA